VCDIAEEDHDLGMRECATGCHCRIIAWNVPLSPDIIWRTQRRVGDGRSFSKAHYKLTAYVLFSFFTERLKKLSFYLIGDFYFAC
jgi:hypothetical protein